MVTEILDLEAFKMYIKANKNSCEAKFDKAISHDEHDVCTISDGLHIIQFSSTVFSENTQNVTQKLPAITCRGSFTAS